MKLQNPFPLEVRTLYLDCWECFLCGENGQRTGGLEIHHILGRVSGCAFNSSCLCKGCHVHVGHSQEEHRNIFMKTIRFLLANHYQPNEDDYDFMYTNLNEFMSEELDDWINTGNRDKGEDSEQEEQPDELRP